MFALVKDGRIIERHSTKGACMVAAYERGMVRNTRGGKYFVPGVQISEENKTLDTNIVEQADGS